VLDLRDNQDDDVAVLARNVSADAADAATPDWVHVQQRARALRRRRAVTGVAAVAAVAAAAALVTTLPARSGPPAPALRPISQVVAWKPAPPMNPTIPQTGAPAFPDPVPARNAPGCDPATLHIGATLDGYGGRWDLSVAVTTRSATPCSVHGRPTVAFSAAGATQQPRQTGPGSTAYRDPVLLSQHSKAVVDVIWSADACPQGASAATAALTLPGDRTPLKTGSFKASPICSDGHPADTTVSVGTFTPPDYRPARMHSAFAFTRAVIGAVRPDSANSVVRFQVTLVSRRDATLSPCPDYEMSVGTRRVAYALNCAGVRFRDTAGNPYLPAGKPVTFAMQGPYSGAATGPGSGKLTWQLRVPETIAAGTFITHQ
jgi:hypothetical protein